MFAVPSRPYLVLLIVTLQSCRTALGLLPDTCTLTQSHLLVEPSADVTIGAVLAVHGPGDGIYGCGPPTVSGVEVFEAMRWAVSVINQNRGLLWGSPPTESPFIPGVKLGLKVYDTCGHEGAALQYLTDLFPVLKSGPMACSTEDVNSTLIVGAVDMSGASRLPRVSEMLRDYLIPTIPLSLSTVVPAEKTAKVIIQALQDMAWERVAILHVENEYSIHVTKLVGQMSADLKPCIVAIQGMPETEGKDPRNLIKALDTLSRQLLNNTGVLVIGQGATLRLLVEAMAEVPGTVSRLQWFFSWVPPPSALARLGGLLNEGRILSLSPRPGRLPPLEEYWGKLPLGVDRPEDLWFLEYGISRSGCRPPGVALPGYESLPVCDRLDLREMPADGLLRTSRATPALAALFTFAHALRKAWEVKCQQKPGVCSSLRHMTRREFVGQFLEPLETPWGGDEGPRKKGRKDTVDGDIDDMKVALAEFTFDLSSGVDFRQLFVYDGETSEPLEVGKLLPSPCSSGGCTSCVRVRQSRLGSIVSRLEDEGVATIGKPDDMFIPVVLPVHEPGDSPLVCGSRINRRAIQDLESALWMVDRINEEATFLPGVRLGVVAIDTCSSTHKIIHRLSNFLERPPGGAESELGSLVAVVASLPPDETSVVDTFLAPLNITTVATGESLLEGSQGPDSFSLQVALPAEVKAKATVEVLEYFGWRYVSLVYDADFVNTRSYEEFKKAAKKSAICLAIEELVLSEDPADVEAAVEKIVEAKGQGSRVLILGTSEGITRALLTSLKNAVSRGIIAAGDLVLLGSGEWEERPDLVKGFESVALGALLFRSRRGEVQDFSTAFRRLRPDSNERNPWFREFWQQEFECDNCTAVPSDDMVLNYEPISSTINTMQGVVAIAAGLARLRNEICQQERGLCPALLRQPQLRSLIHQYTLYTASRRPDQKGSMFKFTYRGYGDTPLDIYNFKKVTGSTFTYQKVGSYHNGLSNLGRMVTYTEEGQEVNLDTVVSECSTNCSSCSFNTVDNMILASPEKIYLALAIGVHEPALNPLSCGPLQPTRGFQNLEAFLWALDRVNENPDLLPGLVLGAVVFDTCNSRERAARDVSNFLSSVPEGGRLPSPDQVIAFIADQTGDVIRPVVDVTMPLKITTVAPAAASSAFGDTTKYPYLLRMSLPNTVMATAIARLLHRFKWDYVSLVYLDACDERDAANAFREEAEHYGIQIAMDHRMVAGETDVERTMDTVVRKLKMKQEEGARVVLLFLQSQQLRHLLAATERLQASGRSQPGDFVWLTYRDPEVFHMYPQQSLGALLLLPGQGKVVAFKQAFEALSIRNNSRNPWFREYWEKVFQCRGVTCYSEMHDSLRQVAFVQDSLVPRTIDSVFALARGLEAVRKKLCPGTLQGTCPQFASHPQLRQMVFDNTKNASFIGSAGNPVNFTTAGYDAEPLDIYNFQKGENSEHVFVSVGQLTEDGTLTINPTRTKGYTDLGSEFLLADLPSRRYTSDTTSGTTSLQKLPPLMEVVPEANFAILASMPVHWSYRLFKCTELNRDSVFQNLVALTFALHRINADPGVLPWVTLGSLVFDHCNQYQRAEEQMFRYFATDGAVAPSKVTIKPSSLVAAITYGDDIAEKLSPVLESLAIPQLSNPDLSGESWRQATVPDSKLGSASPPMVPQVHALLDFLRLSDWKYVHLVQAREFGDEYRRAALMDFLEGAKRNDICIAESISVGVDSSAGEIAERLQDLLEDANARVVVLLLEDVARITSVLQAAKTASVLDRFVWLVVDVTRHHGLVMEQVMRSIDNGIADVFIVQAEDHDLPDFRQYFSGLTLDDHRPIPDSWFEEFWQRHFLCQLPTSSAVQGQFSAICSGRERLDPDRIVQDPYVSHTVRTVEFLARMLHGFLERYCRQEEGGAVSADRCPEEWREEFEAEVHKAVLGTDSFCDECGPLRLPMTYLMHHISRGQNGSTLQQQVSQWKEGNLTFLVEDIQFATGPKPTSLCLGDCRRCQNQKAANILIPRESLFANFKTIWGIIISALSLLGMVLVVICTLYFLMVFPVAVGTTVLGYMILFGLFLLYAVNFAFILAPTEGTCGVRRFVLGFAYAIIFSGMLVKVMNIWRLMGYHGSRLMHDPTRLTSPAGLLVVAVGLVIIQVVLSSAWLILIPPRTGVYGSTWRCAPPVTFEDELIISLVYVMLLLAITILFGTLTWKSQDNNRESRWILTCCVLIGLVWMGWTVLSTRLPHYHRDATIGAANLVSATVAMLCMYLRKVYLYSKLMRQSRLHETKSRPHHPQHFLPSMYGIIPSHSTLSSVMYGSQASLGGKLSSGDRSAPSRMTLIGSQSSDDGKSDSSGSAQVQAADLYPLDMYDGGSQFQPVYGSSLVLDDSLTFNR